MELVKLLEDEKYKMYVKYIEAAQEQLIIKDGFVMFPDLKKKIKPPVTKNVAEELQKLREERIGFLKKYKNIRDKMFFSYENRTEYNNLVKKIKNIDERIEILTNYYEIVNEHVEGHMIDEELKKKRAQLESKNHMDKKSIREYLELLKKKSIGVPAKKHIDFYIEELPQILDIDQDYVAPKKALPTKKDGKITKEQVEVIKDRIKDLLQKKFRFRTSEECSSSKRSQPYYMSKDEIIKTIETDDTLKSIMPKAYKGMNKEKICDSLFMKST